MSIWKQCDVAQSGSGEEPNVCLMWDCPGRCNCCLYKERDGEEDIKNVIKRTRQLVEAVWRSPCRFFFPLMSQPPSFRSGRLPFLMSAPSPGPWRQIKTQIPTTPLPWSCLFALLCLVSVSGEKSEGSGPPGPLQSPQGRPEAPRRELLSASLIVYSSLGSMCNDM